MNDILIKTKKFGDVKVDIKNVFLFPQGIFGFEENRNFALLNFGQKDFFWLQSLDDSKIALMLTIPFYFTLDYKERIAREEYKMHWIAVLSGVGAREYYRTEGYRLAGNYMVKELG
jgi:flagellar assembly factor FliW